MMSFGAKACAVEKEIPTFHHYDEMTKIIPATECSVFFLLFYWVDSHPMCKASESDLRQPPGGDEGFS